MAHFGYFAAVFLIVALLARDATGRSLDRRKRDVVTDGTELELSTPGDDNRANIPVISDIQRVEKIADLLISIGEHVLPALLDGLAEQITAITPERKLIHHTEKPASE